MTGDLDHGPSKRDIERQAAQSADLSANDIAESYEMQIRALSRPPRAGQSPD